MVGFVTNQLHLKAKLYEEKRQVYGDNYKNIGRVMDVLGIKELPDIKSHNRFSILVQIVTKLTRYAENFHRGGHNDSLDDIAVYSMMLKELDNDKPEDPHPDYPGQPEGWWRFVEPKFFIHEKTRKPNLWRRLRQYLCHS